MPANLHTQLLPNIMIGDRTLAAIGMADVNGKMIWTSSPCISRDLEGRPASIVGNVSNKKDMFSLVELPLRELDLFSLMDCDAVIPRTNWGQGPNPIPEARLEGTPWVARLTSQLT